MESVFKIVVGLILMGVSLGYLYRPGLVIRINEMVRRLFFNDAHLLHYRRRWGLLAFLASLLFLYSGFLNMALLRQSSLPESPLVPGYQAFYAGRYDEASAVAVQFLKNNLGDPHGEFLLREARLTKKRLSKTP